jgi:hypothetical protein
LNPIAEPPQFAQQSRRPPLLCEVHSTDKSARRAATGRPPILNERICFFEISTCCTSPGGSAVMKTLILRLRGLLGLAMSTAVCLMPAFAQAPTPYAKINAAAGSNANIEMVSEHTQVVPGHGPVGGRADLVEYRDMLVSIRNRVAELKHQGKSLQQVIAAKPTAPFDARWGQAIISPDLFTTLVYRGV